MSESTMQILSLFLANAGLIIWFRAESRSDWRHMDNKLDTIVNSIREEMREMHKSLKEEMKEIHTTLKEEIKEIHTALKEEIKDFHDAMIEENKHFHERLLEIELKGKLTQEKETKKTKA